MRFLSKFQRPLEISKTLLDDINEDIYIYIYMDIVIDDEYSTTCYNRKARQI